MAVSKHLENSRADRQWAVGEFAKTEDKHVNPESHGFFKKIADLLGG